MQITIPLFIEYIVWAPSFYQLKGGCVRRTPLGCRKFSFFLKNYGITLTRGNYKTSGWQKSFFEYFFSYWIHYEMKILGIAIFTRICNGGGGASWSSVLTAYGSRDRVRCLLISYGCSHPLSSLWVKILMWREERKRTETKGRHH